MHARSALAFSAFRASIRSMITLKHGFLPCPILRAPIKAPSMRAAPTIPGYALLQHLGGGQMTCVYSAQDFATDALCAVKTMRPEWQDEPAAIKLLQREARA